MVRELIQNGQTPELYAAIKDGEYFGSQTFNQSLRKLYQTDAIALDDAMAASDSPEELRLELRGVYKGTVPADFNFDY